MMTPTEIKAKATRKYKAYLAALVANNTFFPLVIPGDKKASKNISDFNKELTKLIVASKDKQAFGYTITYTTRKTKHIGTQSLPTKIAFDTELDYLKFLKKEAEVLLFKKDSKQILTTFPVLKEWMIKYPVKVIAQAGNWGSILKVCHYFKNNPKPNLYIRELPIKVHTKFIEQHKGILKELLNIILADTIQINESQFEKRFNLKYSEPLVRFKLLDQTIAKEYFSGLTDLSIPISQFNQLNLPIEQVIIVENKTNLYTTLTLPLEANTLAIFGKGFQVANIKKAHWLEKVKIFYWGDLDVQGFEILSQMRGYFPHTQSFLMDEDTFVAFFENDSGTPSKVSVDLNLKNTERKIYKKLKANNWRLEQEKIPLPYVLKNFNLFL